LSLPFTIDDDSPQLSAQWKGTDDHLAELGNKYAGSELLVKIEWEFDDSSIEGREDGERSKTGAVIVLLCFMKWSVRWRQSQAKLVNCFRRSVRSGDATTRTVAQHQVAIERRPYIPCWTDSQHRHYKLLSPLIYIWVEAILKKEPGVTIHQPPQSVICLLTAQKESSS
jgi:hypothetical protein